MSKVIQRDIAFKAVGDRQLSDSLDLSTKTLTLPATIAANVTGNLTGTASAVADGAVTAAKLGTNEQRQIAKAWVNFSGVNTLFSGTYTQTGTSVTVFGNNFSAAGFLVGNGVHFNPTSGAGVLGSYLVTAVTTTSMTFTVGTSQSTSGNYTLTLHMIRSSFNVSSVTKNGTGDYTVNFATPMADANYVVCMSRTGGANGVGILDYSGNRAKTTTAYNLVCTNLAVNAFVDEPFINVQVFGN